MGAPTLGTFGVAGAAIFGFAGGGGIFGTGGGAIAGVFGMDAAGILTPAPALDGAADSSAPASGVKLAREMICV